MLDIKLPGDKARTLTWPGVVQQSWEGDKTDPEPGKVKKQNDGKDMLKTQVAQARPG